MKLTQEQRDTINALEGELTMSKIKYHREGVCPLCGSFDIEYGDIDWNTNYIEPMLEQECRCTKCQCEYKEQYNVHHTGKEITYKPNNNEEGENNND